MSEIKLLNGDCLELMKGMPDESVDLIITSPPYNLGNTHHTGGKRFKPYGKYNDDMKELDYQDWQIEVLNECFRVLKSDGSMLYNHKKQNFERCSNNTLSMDSKNRLYSKTGNSMAEWQSEF